MFDHPPIPAPPRSWRSAVFFALALLLATASLEAQIATRLGGWDTRTPQTLNYLIDVDLDCDVHDPTLFHEHDLRQLQVKIANQRIELTRSSSIESSNQHFGPYAFAADGSMTLLADDPSQPDDQKVPPLEAVLLLRVFAGLPLQPQPGVTWSYLDPATTALSPVKIEIQQESNFTHLATRLVGGNTQYSIDIAAELKLIDNLALIAMIGPPADRSPGLTQVVSNLTRDGNLFLFGNILWETKNGATYGKTYAADLTYVGLPFSGGTRASLARSVFRQHIVATLVP